MRNPFKRLKEEKAEIPKIVEETDGIKRKTAKIDRLQAELKDHLKDNNFGQRLYQQMVENWR